MIKVRFSFYSIACCPQQHVQTTETSKECGDGAFYDQSFYWKILVQAIHITLASEEPSSQNIVLKCCGFFPPPTQNKTPMNTHLQKILTEFFFYI